jgi:RimJ/RimL family protein N-acetyltransferase
MFGPVLRGEKISLEPPHPEDGALRLRWFADLEVTRLYTKPGASGMHRALERSGFRRIGTRQRRYVILGVYHDEHIFELLRQDWEKGH